MALRDLTHRQQKFVLEYVKDQNATQACIRAGYSAKTAEQAGPRLLGHVGVREELGRRPGNPVADIEAV